MTKNEIIESLLAQAHTMGELEGITNDSKYAKDADALREAAELLKAAPEWRNAKDDPPEEYKDANDELINYLCYMPKYGVDIANYLKPARVWMCLGIPTKVTHWMALPEKPKEVNR